MASAARTPSSRPRRCPRRRGDLRSPHLLDPRSSGSSRGSLLTRPSDRGAGLRVLFALAVAASLAPGCRCEDTTSPLVQDFEGSAGLKKWPRDAPGEVVIATDWRADGERSLRIDPGLLAVVGSLRRGDFRGFDALRLHVHNPSERLAPIGFELADDHDSLYDRHKSAFGAPPGDAVIEIDLSGDLFRGEENRPYRGPTKTPIDLGSVERLGFENRGDRPVYIDGLTLVARPLPVPAGAIALDFGPSGSRVMGKTAGVFEGTAYDPGRGFGFVSGEPSSLRSTMTYPSPLLGDGLAWGDAALQVDLAGGPYLGWIAFERGGFWETEGEATGYAEAALVVNGAAAHRHTFSARGPHFALEDVEVTRMEDARERMVWPAHAVHRFTFEARRGANTFSLAVRDLRGPPLRVAGLFLAPDTADGKAFVDAQEDRQKRAFDAAFPATDQARRPPPGTAAGNPLGEPRASGAPPAPAPPPGTGKAAPGEPSPDRPAPAPFVVLEQRPAGEMAHPRDEPGPTASPSFQVHGVAGHRAYAQLSVYAREALDVSIRVEVAGAPGGAGVAVERVYRAHYGPTRPVSGGAAWIETHYLAPLAEGETLRVGPDLHRSIVVELTVPAGAPARSSVVRAAVVAGGRTLAELPLDVRVHAVELPQLPLPVGLFMNALPYPPEEEAEERWWEAQERLLERQGEAGLNTPTGGPALEYKWTESADGVGFSGDRALRYLALAKRYGMDRAVVGYTGFLPSIKHARPDAARFTASWAAFEAAHGLPPHYLYSYDEPSTPEELAAVGVYLAPFRAAGARTIGFFSDPRDDRYLPVLDATFAPAVCGHTRERLKGWIAEGRRVFLYNRGTSRLSMGADLVSMIDLGVSGRLEWIGLYSQGFAFDDLDGREPSQGMFVAHGRLGPLPTARWIALREGLIDARVALALRARFGRDAPAAAGFPADYPADPASWPDSKLERARAEALRRLDVPLDAPRDAPSR